jgi:beta-galactosidase beta subunit
METFGTVIEALDGDLQIVVRPVENVAAEHRGNYDAYSEMDDIQFSSKQRGTQQTIELPPSQRVSISTR